MFSVIPTAFGDLVSRPLDPHDLTEVPDEYHDLAEVCSKVKALSLLTY